MNQPTTGWRKSFRRNGNKRRLLRSLENITRHTVWTTKISQSLLLSHSTLPPRGRFLLACIPWTRSTRTSTCEAYPFCKLRSKSTWKRGKRRLRGTVAPPPFLYDAATHCSNILWHNVAECGQKLAKHWWHWGHNKEVKKWKGDYSLWLKNFQFTSTN